MPKGAWNRYEDDNEKMRPGDGVIVSFLTKQYIMRQGTEYAMWQCASRTKSGC